MCGITRAQDLSVDSPLTQRVAPADAAELTLAHPATDGNGVLCVHVGGLGWASCEAWLGPAAVQGTLPTSDGVAAVNRKTRKETRVLQFGGAARRLHAVVRRDESNGAITIDICAPIWLVDRSGLGMRVTDKNVKKLALEDNSHAPPDAFVPTGDAGDDASGAGVALFSPRADRGVVAYTRGADGVGAGALSSALDLRTFVSKRHFAMPATGNSTMLYDMALTIEPCPGVFRRASRVTLMPRICVVNQTDLTLVLHQARAHAFRSFFFSFLSLLFFPFLFH